MTPELTAWIADLNALDFPWSSPSRSWKNREVAQLDLLRSELPALLEAALAAEYARGCEDCIADPMGFIAGLPDEEDAPAPADPEPRSPDLCALAAAFNRGFDEGAAAALGFIAGHR